MRNFQYRAIQGFLLTNFGEDQDAQHFNGVLIMVNYHVSGSVFKNGVPGREHVGKFLSHGIHQNTASAINHYTV
ncbi:hypothetical protein C8K58_1106 [Pseudomonas sp. GV047]|nr:hypothetical protein C8K58_1106 [Pseudomonas sp. GV047]